MSLAVDVYIRGQAQGESLAAGFENWRTQVWGSPQVRAMGATYFPELAEREMHAAARANWRPVISAGRNACFARN